MEPRSLRASVALAAYAEPLLDGRRVVVFGDALSGLAEILLDRGARLVHVYDPEPTRVAEAAAKNPSRDIAFAPLSDSGLAVRDGAFEVGIVEDLTQAGPASSVLRKLRRVLSQRGVAIVAVPNPDVRARLVLGAPVVDGALDYYQLYDAVSGEFTHVRMLGQTPFVGYAVVDFAAGGTPEPSLDSAFVPGGAEEPEWFIALASSVPIRLDEFAVVQLPLRSVALAPRGSDTDSELQRAHEAERRAREKMGELETQVTDLRGQLRTLGRSSPDAAQIVELKKQIRDRDAWIAELEARAAVADARADEAEAELEREREAAQNQTAPLEAVEALEKEIAELRAQAEAANARFAEQSERLRELSELDRTEQTDDLRVLEIQLRERGQEVRRLERDLVESERVGRLLLDDLERLSAENAERSADLEAARWTLETLEGRSEADPELSARFERALGELQRKSVLLAQLRAQPKPD